MLIPVPLVTLNDTLVPLPTTENPYQPLVDNQPVHHTGNLGNREVQQSICSTYCSKVKNAYNSCVRMKQWCRNEIFTDSCLKSLKIVGLIAFIAIELGVISYAIYINGKTTNEND